MQEGSPGVSHGPFRSAGLLLLASALALAALQAAAAFLRLPGLGVAGRYLVSAGLEALLGVPLLVFLRIKRIRLTSLFGGAGVRAMVLAALCGVLLVPVTVAAAMGWNLLVLVTGGNISPYDIPLPATLPELLAAVLAVGVAAPLVEEPLMRGVLLNASAGSLRKTPAILLVTVAFTLMHGRFLGVPSIFFGGLLLAALVWRSGSLWPGVAAHCAYNTSGLLLEAALKRAAAAGGAASALPGGVPEPSALLAAFVAYVFVSLPFLACLGAALWGFWRVANAPQRREPAPGKVLFTQSWPWLASLLLLLGYIAIDVLRVYGIIKVS